MNFAIVLEYYFSHPMAIFVFQYLVVKTHSSRVLCGGLAKHKNLQFSLCSLLSSSAAIFQLFFR